LAVKAEGKRPLVRHNEDGKIIVKWISQNWDGGMDLVHLSQDRDELQALMNSVINCQVP
jgi:hypothetical protein